ncbi:hypothetical protein [Nonomuraea fuscirosea]|uniref:hypothetical protein n=1 Tax=Nonomuraea fuscirosea TaxID=1291556 RepID=UPI00342F38BB
MRLSVTARKRVAGWLLGSMVGIPASVVIGCLATGRWSWLWAGLAAGLGCMVATVIVVPLPERMAADVAIQAARRFPDDVEIEVDRSDTVLVLERRRTWWAANDHHAVLHQGMGRSLGGGPARARHLHMPHHPVRDLPVVVGIMQHTDVITVVSSRVRLPHPARPDASRWGRLRAQAREQWFRSRTGQASVTEAEMRLLTEELRRGKVPTP